MDPNVKVTRNGQVLTLRVWTLTEYLSGVVGKPLRVIQGGFKAGSGADASGSTHDAGDVYDIAVDNLTQAEQLEAVDQFRRWYGDAWLRSPAYGWTSTGAHIHVVQADSFYPLSAGALQQVAAYNNGQNGLSGGGRDPFPQPTPRTHFTMEDDMALTDDDVRRVAEMVWAIKVEDPITKEQVSHRELLRRTSIRANTDTVCKAVAGVVPPADVAGIADAVANEFATRLQA